MTTLAERKTEKEEARISLLDLLAPGDTVTTVVRHVARSGMSRSISALITRDDEIIDISFLVTRLGIGRLDHDGSVRIGGFGMDMTFELVYLIGEILFPEGFGCIGITCPSNDHSNGDRDYKPGDTHWHRNGGYALNNRSL